MYVQGNSQIGDRVFHFSHLDMVGGKYKLSFIPVAQAEQRLFPDSAKYRRKDQHGEPNSGDPGGKRHRDIEKRNEDEHVQNNDHRRKPVISVKNGGKLLLFQERKINNYFSLS